MVADKKKTPLRSTPPRRREIDLDTFAAAAGKPVSAVETVYPWDEAHIREDVKKNLPIRLPEPLYMKLKFIADNTSYSMNSFILERLTAEIEDEIAKITGQN